MLLLCSYTPFFIKGAAYSIIIVLINDLNLHLLLLYVCVFCAKSANRF